MNYIIKSCPKAVSFPSETKCEGTGKYCLEVPTEKKGNRQTEVKSVVNVLQECHVLSFKWL